MPTYQTASIALGTLNLQHLSIAFVRTLVQHLGFVIIEARVLNLSGNKNSYLSLYFVALAVCIELFKPVTPAYQLQLMFQSNGSHDESPK